MGLVGALADLIGGGGAGNETDTGRLFDAKKSVVLLAFVSEPGLESVAGAAGLAVLTLMDRPSAGFEVTEALPFAGATFVVDGDGLAEEVASFIGFRTAGGAATDLVFATASFAFLVCLTGDMGESNGGRAFPTASSAS